MDISSFLPQAITAVATLGGVVLTLILTGRREEKRTGQLLAFEREKILADDQRALFVRTVHELERMRETLNQRAWAMKEGQDEQWSIAVTQRADKLFMLETELRLLAPAPARAVRDATRMARKLRAVDQATPEHPDTLMAKYSEHTKRAMAIMRGHLGTQWQGDGPREMSA